MVVLSTVAAIIASQAVISGAFSRDPPGDPARLPAAPGGPAHLARGGRPGLRARRELDHLRGGGRARASASAPREKLASAYGIAVTGTLAIDTLLFFFVVRALWHRPLWLVIAGAVAFLIVDLTFFAANLTKVLHGGWFPLAIALVVFSVLTTWQRGREIVTTGGSRRRARCATSSTRCASRPAGRPRARHRRVPQRQPGDHAAGAARQRRAQPRAARVRADRVADHRARARTSPRTSGCGSTTSATATTASPTSPAASASRTRMDVPALLRQAAAARRRGRPEAR